MRLARLFSPVLLCVLGFGQASQNTEKIWQDLLGWIKAQRNVTDIGIDKYRASLVAGGLTAAQADERLAVLQKLFRQRQKELGTAYFNKLYTSPEQTRFTEEPNAFLVRTAKTMKPGKALDVAMGQGRNAVYLARQGWDVTGYDLADEGLRVANENAAKAGVRINAVHADFEGFDYGKEQWDLIYFVYTDAPVVDAKFAERICAALKPGGHLLIDRPFRDLDNPDPEWRAALVEQDKPNALLKAYSNLRVLHYEDTMETGDWQQTGTNRLEKQLRVVRLLAKKQ